MHRRLICLTILFCLLSCFMPRAAALGGSGTEDAPFPVTDEAGLRALEGAAAGTWFRLERDISLSGGWTPIERFEGRFSGGGHSVDGLSVSRTENGADAGLFGEIGPAGVVEDLHVSGTVAVSGNQSAAGGLAGTCLGTIRGCTFTGDVSVSGSGNAKAGGLTGAVTGVVRDSAWLGGELTSAASYDKLGGVAGDVSSSGRLVNCYAMGTLLANGTGSFQAGGLVGGLNDSGGIQNCWFQGYVVYSGGYGGGVAGMMQASSAGSVERCFWRLEDGSMATDAVGNGVPLGADCRAFTEGAEILDTLNEWVSDQGGGCWEWELSNGLPALKAPAPKAQGSGSVSCADVVYGESPAPMARSDTNGIAGTAYFFKEKGAPEADFQAGAPKAAGSYTVRAVFPETADYLACTAETDFQISPAPLMIRAKSETVAQGAALPAFSAEYEGFVYREDETALNGALFFVCGADTAVPGAYSIVPGGLSAENYAISFHNGTLTVLADPIIADFIARTAELEENAPYSAVFAVKTWYDALSDAQKARILASGEGNAAFLRLNALLDGYSAPILTEQPANGAYCYGDALNSLKITAVCKNPAYQWYLDGAPIPGETGPVLRLPERPGAGNYTYRCAVYAGRDGPETWSREAEVAVSPRPLTVRVHSPALYPGELLPAFFAYFEGFLPGEDENVCEGELLFTCDWDGGSLPGTYPITASGLTANNYDIAYIPGVLTVLDALPAPTGALLIPEPDGLEGWYRGPFALAPGPGYTIGEALSGPFGPGPILVTGETAGSVRTVYLRSNDGARYAQAVSYKLDAAAPTLAWTAESLAPEAGKSYSTAFFSVSASDLLSGVASVKLVVTKNNIAQEMEDTKCTLTEPGDYRIGAEAVDRAGNFTVLEPLEVHIEAERPAPPPYEPGAPDAEPEPAPKPTPEPEKAREQPVFADTAGHWAEDAIAEVAERGLLDAAGETDFAPDREADRMELVTALWRLAGTPEPEGVSPFADAADAASAWAAGQSLVRGTGGGLLEAERPLTRQELAVLLYRYALWSGMETTVGGAPAYADAEEIPTWARDAAAFCRDKGIVNGKPGGHFAPGDPVTRAEAAVMLQRFLALTGET